jgi:hypothetical protein
MARASIETLLPLDEFARILGIDPWSFNQMRYPAAKGAQCSDVIFQHPWQEDHLSREEIAQAIADAEQMLADELRYWPAPKYQAGEVVQYPRQRTLHDVGVYRPKPKTVQLKWHHIVTPGVFKRTSIGTISGLDLTAADTDGDGIKDTFTATIINAAIGDITDPNEIALYFEAGDRLGQDLDETWRIRPVTISITGTTATIKGHRTLLVKPILQSGVEAKSLKADLDTNYVTSLECHRVFTDSTFTEAEPNQGLAIWKKISGCETDDCGSSSKPLCLGEDNHKLGTVYASYGFPCPARYPDRLEVNYLAGLPLENGQMQPEMARCVAYLAVALLANEKCGCERTNRILAYWKERLTTFEDEVNKAVGFSKIAIPFPVTRGGIFAWERARKWRHSKSVAGLNV